MDRIALFIVIGFIAATQTAAAATKPEQPASPQSALKSDIESVDSPNMPSMPRGSSTVLGGDIQSIDPVRDELTLKVFGQRAIKIQFDERTQVYRDGVRVALRDLRPDEHASVETLLDGTKIFAVSVHTLSRPPAGECKGRVLSYDPGTSILIVSDVLRREPVKLFVPQNAKLSRLGQASFSSGMSGASDLVKGALISVKFESDKESRGVAREIAIFATPGSEFAFSGTLSSLDLHTGSITLIDLRDDESYDIFFDVRYLPTVQTLREQDHVRVSATYNGTRYEANAIALE